ncbi:MAG TPA: hypothetical protein PK109_01715 [Candidatus Paceibacterota bacterium]|nr:hypothetical protein [Candidatus Paceibacterota bacterium]
MPLNNETVIPVTTLTLIEGTETSWSKKMLDRIFTNGWVFVSKDSLEAQTALPVEITEDGAPWLVKIHYSEEDAFRVGVPAVTY